MQALRTILLTLSLLATATAQDAAPPENPALRYQTIFWSTVAAFGLGAAILLWRMHALQVAAHREQREGNARLEQALSQVRELRGLLPICAHCKSIRDDAGYWHRIEAYLTQHSKASLSHGICPTCADDHYPELGIDAETGQPPMDREAG
ncbi:MAG: hypothetical protein ACE37K_07145 [Planctomycetota bacterium]